ncbi:transmembrane protein, putative (macronuclear) [Tetrahymena thermophila SB210]|uniref:Transmembrane protein, putative n=1 Tax=Tetrahymena thermophila (strain SB210) TaxID=312017 RepID=Q24CA6_TETTS|nr:transmembrane protein, putative [Tetrahymena thermophila SB210]EAS05332.2 transmembrane protein, putative [Tetrahymena thermophila SB210]|eukprot:XP_001025577.2 transmembrane protein, putative [Tetrahymena thermophila SB210]
MRWIYIYHLYEFLIFFFSQIRLIYSSTNYPVIIPNNYQITYDSTTKDIYSYYKSQGLVVADKSDPNNIQICHFNNQFNLLVQESVNSIYLYLKVEYILSNSVEYEYIIAFNNERLRGQRIPVINSSNNIPGSPSFFYDSIYIFQMSYIFQDSIKPAQTDMNGVELTHNTNNSQLQYYLCLNQGIYIATLLEGSIQTQLSFSKYTFAQNLISGTACKSIIKQNYSTVLINQNISCNPQGCTKYSVTVDTSVFLEINDSIKQSTYSISETTWNSLPYSWTSVPILYAFDYQKSGQYTLYILADQTNQMILINIRDQVDNQIFVGQLQGITNLSNRVISYNTNALYVVETTKKTNAQIIAFCINSTFNNTQKLCVKTTDSNCLFENNSVCLLCSSTTFIDPISKLCVKCPDTCVGCTSANICTSCISNYRDPNNSCQCTGGRVENPSVRLLLEQKNQPRNLQFSTCVCPNQTYEDPKTKNCISCSSISTFCLNCDAQGCNSCSQGSYLSNKTCIPCQQNCLSCSQSSCSNCQSGYYINNTQQCSSCSSLVTNCVQCTSSGCSQCAQGYYLKNNQCLQCSPNCSNGCSTELICNSCYTPYRDVNNKCACIGGTTEQPGSIPGQGQCVCQNNQYYDTTNNICKLCSQSFGSTCTSCLQTGCITCDSSSGGQYIDPNSHSCVACATTFGAQCLSCSTTQCSTCNIGYYLNAQNQCTNCNQNCSGGCSSANKCNSCYTNYRDPNNQCNCIDGRHSVPASNQNQRILQSTHQRLLGQTDQCVCNSDRVEQPNGQCQLCSALFGSQCTSCNLQTCLTCINGSYANQSGICQCPSDQYLDVGSLTCLQCATQYSQYCKSCSSTTCLDCGDPNSQYIPTTKACQCIQGYFVSSRVNNSFTCQQCSQKYGSNCTVCNETICQNCQNGYIYNPTSQQCECPVGYAVKDNICKPCSQLYNKYCSQCDNNQCNLCSQLDRNPLTGCSCSQSQAADLNGQCYYCSINLSTQTPVALATIINANIVCNFNTGNDGEESNKIQGQISIYLALSYNFVNSYGVIQKNTKQYLLSNTYSIQNLVLPHGNHQIISNFTSTGSQAFTQISTISVSVSSVYNNMQQLYINYFSFKSLSSKLDLTQLVKYLVEILEVKMVQSDNISIQQKSCSSISQNGSICVCSSSSSYFADCSGSNQQYSQFQQIMLQYSSFLNNNGVNLTKLQQIQFNYLLPLVNEQIDSTFISKDSTQVDSLVSTIQQQSNQFNDITNLPQNFSQQASQVTQQISGLLDSPSISQENTQKAMKVVTQIQQASLQTINPYYKQVNKPEPVPQIITNNLLLDQKLIKCSSANFTAQNIQYIIGDPFSGSQNNRFLGVNEQAFDQPTLQIRILDSSQCQAITAGSEADKNYHYNGVSASIYKSNPYQNLYELPYQEQRYQFFSTQLKYFDPSQQRILDSSTQESNPQLYSLQFKVVNTNPQDSSTKFNNTLFKCIYFNQTAESSMKWSQCPQSYFLAQSRILGCSCPTQSTYVYDYDNIFTDDSTHDLIEEAKKKQTTLIIIAIILAAVFIILIILYAFIYKPKHIIYELAQLGKQQELQDSNQVKINEKLQTAKVKDNVNDETKKFNNIISAQSTPMNQLAITQALQQLKNKNNYSPNNIQNQQANNFSINSNNINNINNVQYSSAKFNQNLKFDTFGNNSSFQQNKKMGASFQDNQEALNSNNRSIQLNPSIFNNISKFNVQHNNLTDIPLPSVNERKEYLQTFENNYTERNPQEHQSSDKRLEEIQTHNYLKTNANTNRDIQSNAKLQLSNSEENIEVGSKIQFTSQSLSKQPSNQGQKKDIKVQEDNKV